MTSADDVQAVVNRMPGNGHATSGHFITDNISVMELEPQSSPGSRRLHFIAPGFERFRNVLTR
jgi:hypothetical protein